MYFAFTRKSYQRLSSEEPDGDQRHYAEIAKLRRHIILERAVSFLLLLTISCGATYAISQLIRQCTPDERFPTDDAYRFPLVNADLKATSAFC